MLDSRQAVEMYMPHSGAMVLIDRVIEHGSGHIVTEMEVGSHLPGYAHGRVPAYLGIEVMAQSVALWWGLCRQDPSTDPPIGFLLGTRRFESSQAYLAAGNTLRTRAHQVLTSDTLAMFGCELQHMTANDAWSNVATANISVYLRLDDAE